MNSQTLDLFARDEVEDAIETLHVATAFFTVDPVVDQLLGMVDWPRGDKRLVESSAGDGAFLTAALRKLLAARPNVTNETIADLMCGYEIHAPTVADARGRIEQILVDHGRVRADARAVAAAVVIHGDFVKDCPDGQVWDVCIGNPPFLKMGNVPDVLRSVYKKTLPSYSLADLLHGFIAKCAAALKPGGELSFICSDRWLFSSSAAELRAVIGDRFGIAHLKRLDCSSSFYRPKSRRAGQPPRIHPVAVCLRDTAECVKQLSRAPIYPDADDSMLDGRRTLADVSNIRLAPWLGPHGIFVIGADVAATLPAQHLVPVVDTDNIKGGVYTAPTKFAIRTHAGEEPPAAIMEHLDANLHRMPRSKQRSEKRWLPPESFARMDLSQPSLLVPRIASALRPVRIPAGVLPIDHGISIVAAGEATLDEIEEELRRPEAEAWVRARAPRLENQFWSATTTLLRQLPVSL